MKKTGSEPLLLDTNAVIDYFKGNPAIVSIIKKAASLFVPSIVLGELYFGANNSSNKRKHVRQINKFLTLCEVLPINSSTALQYGMIKAALKKKGKPIPENDIWIASIAKQYKLPILTNDNHFKEVEKIILKNW